MNNKEILKNVLVTVGLLTTSIVALVYCNSKLNESTNHRAIVISPSATIHPYTPSISSRAVATTSRTNDVATNAAAVAPNTPTSVNAADYPNNLVIHASSGSNAALVTSGANSSSSIAPKSNIVQQRQQMQMGALTAVNSRRLTSETSTPITNNTQVGEPFQETSEVPGSISRKNFPDEPEEPFPDEEVPLGEGMLVLLSLSFVYGIRKRLNK